MNSSKSSLSSSRTLLFERMPTWSLGVTCLVADTLAADDEGRRSPAMMIWVTSRDERSLLLHHTRSAYMYFYHGTGMVELCVLHLLVMARPGVPAAAKSTKKKS